MFSSITTGAVFGITSYLMQVETDISDGLPSFSMVGFLGGEVREAGDRVRVALRSAGVDVPNRRITISFSPADIQKRGVVADLAVAAGILAAMGILQEEDLRGVLVAGELGLDGEIKPIRGVLPIVQKAAGSGIRTCILPEANAPEGAVVRNIRVVGVRTLRQMIRYLLEPEETRNAVLPPVRVDLQALFREKQEEGDSDFADIHGQDSAKRALTIAAAGFHNVLLIGPPGSGKSMLAKSMPGIMPPFTVEESMEVSGIYSVAGLIPEGQPLITKRPFLAPHHTITRTALAGGGMIPSPGVITLADRGVLFLDEFPEFGRENLNLLRQPMEDHEIRISRTSGTFVYPARCLVLAAMNPCPCGYFPDPQKCRCTAPEIERYLSHISGPILDRIDLCAETPRVEVTSLLDGKKEESSADIRGRVMSARERQIRRFEGTGMHFNGEMDARAVEKYCVLGKEEADFMKTAFEKLQLSARAYHRTLKTARTIADLRGGERISADDLAEALGYRVSDRKYWKKWRTRT